MLEVADRRHRERVVVVVEGVGADDRAVDAAVPALPDPAEPVDEEVVADVGPAAGLRVVRVDAAQDARHLGARVVVGVDRVVDEAGVHLEVVQRALRRASSRRHPTGRASRSAAWACTSPPGARSSSSASGSVARVGRRCSGSAVVAARRRPSSVVSSAGRSTAVCVRRARVDDRELHVGRQLAGRRPAGPGPRRRRRPAAASVPGRACRASSLSGSGPCSSWYSSSHPVGPRVTGAGADLHRDARRSGTSIAVLPGDADRAVPGDRLRRGW